MLWMTRTPLRISLFGGGTDYTEYFDRHPGAVVGLTINQYIHITALQLRAFQDYHYRVAYSKLEFARSIGEIGHPVVREVLRDFQISERLDISVASDLPASGSGLGSSSAFTVGFINLVLNMLGRPGTKIDLARAAIRAERELLRENVGVQDQLHAAFGGVNRFDFNGDRIQVTPVQVSGEALRLLDSHMVIIHTGIARRATEIISEQVKATKENKLDNDLSYLYSLVAPCVATLERANIQGLSDLGAMLSEAWHVKRRLSSSVSNEVIDDLYKAIIKCGAYGAKLCGAGGGGFFFALIPPDRQDELRRTIGERAVVPVKTDVHGTTLVYPAHLSL